MKLESKFIDFSKTKNRMECFIKMYNFYWEHFSIWWIKNKCNSLTHSLHGAEPFL